MAMKSNMRISHSVAGYEIDALWAFANMEYKLRLTLNDIRRGDIFVDPDEVVFVERSTKGKMIALILDADEDELEEIKLVKIKYL
jgi:hypothetical protein